MALALVKSSTIASAANVGSLATSFASLPSAGNMIVVLVSAWRSSAANISSVTDNQGNTYTKAIDRNGGNGGLNEASIWYCASIGSPSGTHTITANATAGVDNYIVVIASEVSGQNTSAPFDASTSAAVSTTGDVATGTTAALAQADEIVFIAASVSSSSSNITIDTPATYTRIGAQQDSNTYVGFEGSYKIVAATTAVVGQWSHDNTGQDEASGVIATFKAADGGDPISAFQHDAFQGDAFQFGAIVSSGGVDVTVTPGVGSLTLTGYAGTLTADSSATPGVQALAITGLAPTVSAAFSATPGVGSLTLTGLAPTVTAASSATPGVQALALTGLAPTVTGASSADPGPGSLTLTGFAPTLTADSSATPDVHALIITGYAPTVTASSGAVDVTVTPGLGSLVLTGFAPTLSADASVTPDVGSLTLTGYAPTVSTGGQRSQFWRNIWRLGDYVRSESDPRRKKTEAGSQADDKLASKPKKNPAKPVPLVVEDDPGELPQGAAKEADEPKPAAIDRSLELEIKREREFADIIARLAVSSAAEAEAAAAAAEDEEEALLILMLDE